MTTKINLNQLNEQVIELITSKSDGDHRNLSGRDAENQHPISSISDLQNQLDRIPKPIEALTNFELEELLK